MGNDPVYHFHAVIIQLYTIAELIRNHQFSGRIEAPFRNMGEGFALFCRTACDK